jgi:histidinol-phosphatase (PHP family)
LSAPTPRRYAPFSPDFLVGSVHYLAPADRRAATGPFSVDGPIDVVARGLEECFGGSGRRAATAYWGAVREMVESCDFDVVGHLDLARKHNARLGLFDESARVGTARRRAPARARSRARAKSSR